MGVGVEEDSEDVDEVVVVVGSAFEDEVVVDLDVVLVVDGSLEEVVVDSFEEVVVGSAAVADADSEATGVSDAPAVSALVAVGALLARFTLDDILARGTGNHDKERVQEADGRL